MSGSPLFSVAAIRQLAAERADGASLRSVAAEIPMSYTAFHHFLRGGKPQAETLARLVRWYADTRRGSRTIDPGDVSAAIRLLSMFIAEAGTPIAMARRREKIFAELTSEAATSD